MKNRIQATIRLPGTSPKKLKPLLRLAIETAASCLPKKSLGAPGKRDVYTIDLNVVTAPTIRRLNRLHLRKDKITDVLAFPQFVPHLKSFSYHIGDILICWSRAKSQARSKNIPVEFEMAELAIHGTLHLFGYDHERGPKARKVMFGLQQKALRLISSQHFNAQNTTLINEK